jgi:hypothetical protein
MSDKKRSKDGIKMAVDLQSSSDSSTSTKKRRSKRSKEFRKRSKEPIVQAAPSAIPDHTQDSNKSNGSSRIFHGSSWIKSLPDPESTHEVVQSGSSARPNHSQDLSIRSKSSRNYHESSSMESLPLSKSVKGVTSPISRDDDIFDPDDHPIWF